MIFRKLFYFRYYRFKKRYVKNQKWHKLFDSFRFEQGVSVKKLRYLATMLVRDANLLKHLPKPVHEYDEYDDLCGDLYKHVDAYRDAKTFINESLPKSIRDQIKPDLKDFSKLYYEKCLQIEDIAQKKNYKKLLKGLNKLGLNLRDQRLDLMRSKINELENLDQCNILVRDEKELVLICDVDFYTMSVIGSGHWCISQSYEHWCDYVGKNQQLIVWDFNIQDKNPDHMVGITFNKRKKEILHSFNVENDKIKTGKMYKYIHLIYAAKVHHQ